MKSFHKHLLFMYQVGRNSYLWLWLRYQSNLAI